MDKRTEAVIRDLIRQQQAMARDIARLQRVEVPVVPPIPPTPTAHSLGLGYATILTSTVTQAIAVSPATPSLTWDTEIRDDLGGFDAATNNQRITIPAGMGGVYDVGAAIAFQANATGIRQCWLWKNGATKVVMDSRNAVSSFETYLQPARNAVLNAGDYIVVQVLQTSPGALNSLAVSQAPYFWAVKVA